MAVPCFQVNLEVEGRIEGGEERPLPSGKPQLSWAWEGRICPQPQGRGWERNGGVVLVAGEGAGAARFPGPPP